MEKFTQLTGVAAPLPIANVDTDLIIPARYMKGLGRDGLGKYLFHAIRYAEDGTENPEFPLNLPAYRSAAILLADRNFGCGSSREHAVWALADFGIRCIIAPDFGTIFAGNARKNGMLLISLPEQICCDIRDDVIRSQGAPMIVDLVAQTIRLASGQAIAFAIEPGDRRILLEGLDDIARTLLLDDAITGFENAA